MGTLRARGSGAAAELAHFLGLHVRRKAPAHRASFNLDEIARLQIGPGADGADVRRVQHELPELAVVDDEAVAGRAGRSG